MTTKSKLFLAVGIVFLGIFLSISSFALYMIFVFVPMSINKSIELNKKRSAETFGTITSVSQFRSSGDQYSAPAIHSTYDYQYVISGVTYDAEQMHRMGAVNIVADHADLERVALDVAVEITGKSPTSQRMLKYAFNLLDDGLVGQQLFAGEATRLAYMTAEAEEGRDAFLEKRRPDWSSFPWYF